MNKTQLSLKIEMLERELKHLKAKKTGCVDCQHHDTDGYCEHWKSEIPKDVITVGCDEWLDDGCPF
jgi:hypothetical protein